jgi:hypothetical protein
MAEPLNPDPAVRAFARGAWHPPLALRRSVDAFAYRLRQDGLTYQEIGDRMGSPREAARQRIARHEARLRKRHG